ncbi:GNAT family N-acetyltransferase [Lutimaribacter sp. EGI FJ00015]|uniref:GNAT family N-acetyltransferase n=1 Tax=Lutimaribacter degradans TaxID=2945989 RepID=A0ACC5ZTD7_9RHOB|nr:GNAT family protein [Lutimaribacter sp. EGI FJ00013]MCM2561604.1 GNAT family N-acetyltransferase [Lutimaribacter sp. EGI FJ00013]MCO0612685.1 GNAT family N-acetyltransferase [Lutimaribacter sp. EGI FJ00015]MCO0635343.1 GNAT family N-acetyltransferase [Lutimaribacter sp. EGI FJ00014]
MTKSSNPLADWAAPSRPDGAVLEGRFARLEPLDADRHAALLYREFAGHDDLWTYMAAGPFASAAQYHRWAREHAGQDDPFFYVIQSRDSGVCGGVASFMRITPEMGVIELGYITLSPALSRSRAATEAFFLMMQWAFDRGYRRFEWKCDAGNLPSRRAAQRLGLSYEGVFRQHMIVKGRNRDTAWFAATDADWPALKEAFNVWLAPGNFDAQGQQRERLSDLTRLVRVSSDPALTSR